MTTVLNVIRSESRGMSAAPHKIENFTVHAFLRAKGTA
jgi:hypothetical protein